MNKERAKTIASSTTMANVTYNGAQVYIESVDDNKETACIHQLGQPTNKQEVSLNSLIEQ
ncbi:MULTISPECIES: H-type small acid-soluble spore protein [Clostridium]|uniref:Small, acid-soluble spore protein H n=1 Tax=Clostridium cibarium TaxID=2762247 RepID=A0ABR8PVE8_9CLOT|nr:MULTISPECIES: H-type small acid-soluble spore protein [Clostridium]MBD7912163.1 H-type small acid-soluble spore protein [Clostridium cibarium]